jgi:hypothetical protein
MAGEIARLGRGRALLSAGMIEIDVFYAILNRPTIFENQF